MSMRGRNRLVAGFSEIDKGFGKSGWVLSGRISTRLS